MPTYDYVCEACGHEFEHFQSMSDKLLRTCPKCAKKKLVRKVGAGAGLIFKGSGFYITDYKKSGSSPAGDASSRAGSEGKPGSEGKSGSGEKSGSGGASGSEGASGTSGSGAGSSDAKASSGGGGGGKAAGKTSSSSRRAAGGDKAS